MLYMLYNAATKDIYFGPNEYTVARISNFSKQKLNAKHLAYICLMLKP